MTSLATTVVLTGDGDGSSHLWIAILVIAVLAPIVVGLVWRWWDRRQD